MLFHRNFTQYFNKTKHILILILITQSIIAFSPLKGISQSENDNKIIITVNNTDSLYWQVKYALGKCDYIIREDGNRDSLRTFAARSPFMEGFTVVLAVIKTKQVELSGFYGLSQFDGWLFTHQPNNYKPIIYFKNSKAWRQLMYITSKINYSEITFAQ